MTSPSVNYLSRRGLRVLYVWDRMRLHDFETPRGVSRVTLGYWHDLCTVVSQYQFTPTNNTRLLTVPWP